MSLQFQTLKEKNIKRSRSIFPECAEWTVNDWVVALAGEAGEAANQAKKIKRAEKLFEQYDTAVVIDRSENPVTKEQALGELGKELADVVLYADLIATHLGMNLETLVIDKFNEVSQKLGSEITM